MTYPMTQPIKDYVAAHAGQRGYSFKSVTRALAEDRIPGAYQDDAGKWWIPADAEIIQAPTQTAIARVEPAAPVTELATYQASADRKPTVLEQLDELPAYVTVADAATILGIPRQVILDDPAQFDAQRVGRTGRDGVRALMVPQAAIRRIRG